MQALINFTILQKPSLLQSMWIWCDFKGWNAFFLLCYNLHLYLHLNYLILFRIFFHSFLIQFHVNVNWLYCFCDVPSCWSVFRVPSFGSEKESSRKLALRFWQLVWSLKMFQFKWRAVCLWSRLTKEQFVFGMKQNRRFMKLDIWYVTSVHLHRNKNWLDLFVYSSRFYDMNFI